MAAGIGTDGFPAAWFHRLAGPSILTRLRPEAVRGQIDPSSTDGAKEMPYHIPNLRVECVQREVGVPVGFWRSVGHSQNAFAVECFLDEVAEACGIDPFELRRRLLAKHDRLRAVLELAAEKAGWGVPLSPGVGRGIAAHASFGSYVAQVAEVSASPGGGVRVHRVVCAVDCGRVVHPGIVEAQMEGGILFGLTAVLRGRITIQDGAVRQGNFHDYPLLRIGETPEIEVHRMPSAEAPGGVGEPGVPPLAPAVVNAFYAATGKRVRRLPLERTKP